MNMNIEIQQYNEFDDLLIDEIYHLECEIFDSPYSKEKLKREGSKKTQLLILIAYLDGKAVGYKVGHEQSSQIFYSWIGGVLPEYRNNKIARKLMDKQHQQAFKLGYQRIRTFTENRYKAMLILNLKCGFDVIGVYKSDHDEKQTIMLEKILA